VCQPTLLGHSRVLVSTRFDPESVSDKYEIKQLHRKIRSMLLLPVKAVTRHVDEADSGWRRPGIEWRERGNDTSVRIATGCSRGGAIGEIDGL
jgi:hypothetical protein